MKRLFVFLVFIFGVIVLRAATPPDSSKQIPVGYWRTHLSYMSVNQVTETPDRVYGVSDGALFSYDKENESFDIYSKIDGLSDNTVTYISYSTENKLLLIVYENSNIDLLTDDGQIFNIFDIKEKNLSNKNINSVTFSGSKVYLSTGYGISVINLIKREISDSYLLNNTFSTAIVSDTIFAATDAGIMKANINSNLVDPNNWIYDDILKADYIISYQNKLYAIKRELGLYELMGKGKKLIASSPHFRKLFVSNNTLVAYGVNQLSLFDASLKETIIWGQKFYSVSALNPRSKIWFAAKSEGINRFDNIENTYTQITLNLKPDGPLANSPFRLKFSGNKLMIVGGSAWDNRRELPGLMMFYQDDKWDFQKVDTIQVIGGARDFVDIVEDPSEINHYFVSSFGEGVYEFRNKKLVKIHDHTNSTIETVVDPAIPRGSFNYDRVFGLLYDKMGNLLVCNIGVDNSIKILSKDMKWSSFSYAPIANKAGLFQLIQTKKGVFWCLNSFNEPGIFVFDPKQTLSDQSDDQFKFFSSIDYLDNLEKRSIKPELFFCLAEDKNGAIWVGTDMGPIVFNSPSKVFSDNFLGSRIKVPRNDGTMLADYLLDGEKISAICVDGGNRKWIGTESNGVYFVSENGQETYAHYTAENSPLFSNRVYSIAIHPTTGEVFIGTDKGLVSFRSDAIEGKKNYSEVYAFPNPVRPDYDGLVTITGLKSKSTVRITDLNGNSLFEGESAGGQIVWDGRTRQGKRPASGVYLVYAATSDASEGVVTKILFVK